MIITSDLACPGQDQSSSKTKPGKRNNFNLLTKSESIVISRLGRESKLLTDHHLLQHAFW